VCGWTQRGWRPTFSPVLFVPNYHIFN